MKEPPVVSNASPLIALEQIGQLWLLERLFESVLIPPAVTMEIEPTLPLLPSWIEVRHLHESIIEVVQAANLGEGESEAISLALEISPHYVILDEAAGRNFALGLGLPVIGVVGLLLKAKRKGLIPAIRPLLDNLLNFKFRISPALYKQTLLLADEDQLNGHTP